MKKLIVLLVLAGLTAGAIVLVRQQQFDLEARRDHVEAPATWRASNAALVAAGLFAA